MQYSKYRNSTQEKLFLRAKLVPAGYSQSVKSMLAPCEYQHSQAQV
jgi:hypothetical protein